MDNIIKGMVKEVEKIHDEVIALLADAYKASIRGDHDLAIRLRKQAYIKEKDAAYKSINENIEPLDFIICKTAAVIAEDLNLLDEAEELIKLSEKNTKYIINDDRAISLIDFISRAQYGKKNILIYVHGDKRIFTPDLLEGYLYNGALRLWDMFTFHLTTEEPNIPEQSNVANVKSGNMKGMELNGNIVDRVVEGLADLYHKIIRDLQKTKEKS